jgi:hypothetical protein
MSAGQRDEHEDIRLWNHAVALGWEPSHGGICHGVTFQKGSLMAMHVKGLWHVAEYPLSPTTPDLVYGQGYAALRDLIETAGARGEHRIISLQVFSADQVEDMERHGWHVAPERDFARMEHPGRGHERTICPAIGQPGKWALHGPRFVELEVGTDPVELAVSQSTLVVAGP